MSIFKKNINRLLEEASTKGIEDNLASSLALVMMKSEFANKFPRNKNLETRGTSHNNVIEIIANLKIDKDETYNRSIEINNKSKIYKIILRKDTINEWKQKQKNKKVQGKKILQKHSKNDNDDFIKMLKGIGLIFVFICIYFIIRLIFF